MVEDHFAGTCVVLCFKAVAQNQSENEQLNALQAKTTFTHLFHPLLEHGIYKEYWKFCKD